MDDEQKFAKGDLAGVMAAHSHVADWVRDFEAQHGSRPIYYGELDRGAKKERPYNLIYITKEPIFVHIYEPPEDDEGGGQVLWFGLEPQLTDSEEHIRRELIETLLQEAPTAPSFTTDNEFENILGQMIERYTVLDTDLSGTVRRQGKMWQIIGMEDRRLTVTQNQRDRLHYVVIRDLIRNGPLEPLLSDEMLEDIHSVGLKHIHMDHKVFGMVTSNIRFRDRDLLSRFLRAMSERIGRPVSDNKPIIDGALLDGSRINIIFSDDVSMLGPSFTIRKFAEETISITQLIQWKTISAQVAAYIWICLEYGMSVLVSGETASGKTTTLNAILPFIDHNVKIYSAEDTPEVKVRHKLWQRLVTRSSKNEESRVEMFDLLKAALRSRPRYIIIGEIRGEEGLIAFQAMQTGHPVMATFHAASVQKLIQRLVGDPILVPKNYVDNLNLAVIQVAVRLPDGKMGRRAIAINEIVNYDSAADAFSFVEVFQWDPVTDTFEFTGFNNSYLLEQVIAPARGYPPARRRQIYSLVKRRARILEKLAASGLEEYQEVYQTIAKAIKDGVF